LVLAPGMLKCVWWKEGARVLGALEPNAPNHRLSPAVPILVTVMSGPPDLSLTVSPTLNEIYPDREPIPVGRFRRHGLACTSARGFRTRSKHRFKPEGLIHLLQLSRSLTCTARRVVYVGTTRKSRDVRATTLIEGASEVPRGDVSHCGALFFGSLLTCPGRRLYGCGTWRDASRSSDPYLVKQLGSHR
jgi:hypothetical protein